MNPLVAKITAEIEQNGPMTFARFMERALYQPELGYYERQKEIGRRGDFFTSVSVGSLFGELLAFQFAEWLEELRIADCGLRIVEAGAHDGRLAADILNWLKKFRPQIFDALEYWIIEPSAAHQQWQRETLKEFSPRIKWARDFSALAQEFPAGLNGIIFSNELLDAMPVHRLSWNAEKKIWGEWLVDCDGQKFVWKLASVATELAPRLPVVVPELAVVLPDGFTTEISPAASEWWEQAAKILQRGKLVAIDYGLSEEEFFQTERSGGTLRAFSKHHLNDDLLANPGEQDITAHVNFTTLQRAGEGAGLVTKTFCSQQKFLTLLAERTWKEPGIFGEWSSPRVKQFQTLTHPEHLGRAFRVLVQSKEFSRT